MLVKRDMKIFIANSNSRHYLGWSPNRYRDTLTGLKLTPVTFLMVLQRKNIVLKKNPSQYFVSTNIIKPKLLFNLFAK